MSLQSNYIDEKYTGKTFDPDTSLYYYNARWYDPQLGRFITEDPIRDGQNWFIYAKNNPLRFLDPTGLTTEINESTGEVVDVLHDDDTSILAYPYVDGEKVAGPAQLIGESLEVDSFESPDTGNPVGIIYPDESIDGYVDNKIEKAGEYGKDKTFIKSRPKGEFDIKTQYPGHEGKSYHGFLLRDKYVTLREAGNILAGMNAAQFKMPFDEFQKGAGALHEGGLLGAFLHVTTGKTYGTAPLWGENEYQYTRSKHGYNSYRSEEVMKEHHAIP